MRPAGRSTGKGAEAFEGHRQKHHALKDRAQEQAKPRERILTVTQLTEMLRFRGPVLRAFRVLFKSLDFA